MEADLSQKYQDWQKPCDLTWSFIDRPHTDIGSDITYHFHGHRRNAGREWLIFEAWFLSHKGSIYESKVRQEFQALRGKWHEETRLSSSISAKIFNVWYQRIIGLGSVALPLIFSELKERGGHWYWALECITGDNPASNAQTIVEAKRAWLDYGVSRGYL